MGKILVVYTMKGCPWCKDFKKGLKEKSIKFTNRDIEKHEDEYQLFVNATNSNLVPAFMIVDKESETAELFVPDRDYEDLETAYKIIEEKI
jgi:glutaredoxin